MKHSNDTQRPHSGHDLETRFVEVLDDLTGIRDGRDPDPPQQVQPVPLSPGMIDRTLSELRALCNATAPGTQPHPQPRPQLRPQPRRQPRSQRRPWWQRRAAVIPIATFLFLGAATPIFLVWSGRNSSEELYYEDALDIVFDHRYPQDARAVAQGRVFTSIQRGITTIKRCAPEGGSLGGEVARAVGTLKAMVADPDSVTPGRVFRRGRYELALATLADSKRSPSQRTEALQDIQEQIRSGICVLRRARDLGPRFERGTRLFFGYMARRLDSETK